MKGMKQGFFQRFFSKKRCSQNIIRNGKNITFLDSADVVLTEGASRENIVIGKNTVIGGTLWAKGFGSISIGDNVSIGESSLICAISIVTIGTGTSIGHHTYISDHNIEENGYESDADDVFSAPIVIGKNCTIGNNVVIYKGATIADGCSIPDNTIVKNDILTTENPS